MDGLVFVILLGLIILIGALLGTDSRGSEHGTAEGHRTGVWW